MARKPATSPATALDGLPVWAKTISVVGAPTAAAAALIYGLYAYLPQINAKLDAIDKAASVAHEAYRSHMIEESKQDDRIIAVLQQICLGGAHTDMERVACVSLERPK